MFNVDVWMMLVCAAIAWGARLSVVKIAAQAVRTG